MMTDDYDEVLKRSERLAWKLDDVLSADATFDYGRPFLPEALARTEALPFLDRGERLTLNHIRAHGYLAIFGLVEEFILPYVVERLEARMDARMSEVRALLAFANEEAKHIALFRRFREVFERGFGHRCEVIGPPEAVREHVLSHGELGVGLLILHIEWMTQRHYVEMVRGDEEREPSFARLLHQHWLEECQHALIDGWIVEALASTAPPAARKQAFGEYVEMLGFLDGGLGNQVELDIQALERATRRSFDAEQRETLRQVQHAAQRATFLGSGVGHPRLRGSVDQVYPGGLATLDDLATSYA